MARHRSRGLVFQQENWTPRGAFARLSLDPRTVAGLQHLLVTACNRDGANPRMSGTVWLAARLHPVAPMPRTTRREWTRRDFLRAAGVGASAAALAPFIPVASAQ